MAPSNMFSYLRPGHNKRNASSPSLPALERSSPLPIPQPSPSIQLSDSFPSPPQVPGHGSHASGSPISPYPPQLPPIPRVASQLKSIAPGSTESQRPRSGQSCTENIEPKKSLNATQCDSRGEPSQRQTQRPRTQHSDTPPASSSSFLSPSNIASNYSSHSKSQTSLLSGLSEKLSSTPKMSSTPTAATQKSGKSRLNLRNPMSLLMRRKSSQPLQSLSDDSIVTHLSPSLVPPLPENYDPSIRGRIVHDFSAPRPNRNFSYNNAYKTEGDRAGTGNTTGEAGRVSPQKIDREHTPVFREHFDDDTSYEESQAAIRAEKLANNDFIARNSWVSPPLAPSHSPPAPPPPLPKDPPLVPAPHSSMPSWPPPPTQSSVFETSVLSPVEEGPDSAEQSTIDTPRKRKTTMTMPSTRSRATSVTDPNGVPDVPLAHHTSKSSRFSFQISGSDSAQEKMLEERHMRKAAEKASKQNRLSTNSLEDGYDDYDMEEYDMDDGLEEEIPMIGDDGFGDPSSRPGLSGFDFSSLQGEGSNIMAPLAANSALSAGTNSSYTDPIPSQYPGYLPEFGLMPMPQSSVVEENDIPVAQLNGLGLTDVDVGTSEVRESVASETLVDANIATMDNSCPPKSAEIDLGDDLYFDDGMIEAQGDMGTDVFDEEVFDDPAGPLFERKVKPPSVGDRLSALHSNPPDIPASNTVSEHNEDLIRHLNKTEPALAHAPSMAQRTPMPDLSNLEAYHSALADAAQRAEAEGRFNRKASVDAGSGGEPELFSSQSNSRPSLIPDDGRPSEETAGFSMDEDLFGMSSGFVDDYNYSEYDSALEDDPMIAEANAEALANDYEGVYGTEFGFYASAQGESLNAYGGYFGPSSIGRSTSGRNAVREPNLTPITERSEYSTRNSFISLNHFRDGQQPLQSPGLAQLARMSPYGWHEDDPDMSMDTLMKLRKGAFGSTASLGGSSAGSPRNSSPLGMQFVPRTASAMANHAIAQGECSEAVESDGSAFVEEAYDDAEYSDAIAAVNESSEDYEEDNIENSRPESPTLTASDYNSLSSRSTREEISQPLHTPYAMKPPPRPLTVSTTFNPSALHSIDTSVSSPVPPSATGSAAHRQSLGLISPISTTSPITPGCTAWKPSHSRKTSTADSVTYVKEHDETGGDRWILERRRTAESGELELVGREIVEGGRI